MAKTFQKSLSEEAVKDVIGSYTRSFDEQDEAARKAKSSSLTNDYYDLVTDFYEYGWGQSFHFAPRHRGESVRESIVRHEHRLALRLGLTPGMKVLDVGCGVGGPMRNIARISGAHVNGITINQYQVDRGTRHNEKERLTDLCTLTQGDFTKMPFEAGSFDAAYTIEACCHAADRRAPFGEVFRVLKPGAYFAGYEWCLTDGYDAANEHHRRVKLGVERGDGLPDLVHTSEIDRSLKDVGFELLEARDLVGESHPETPWYESLRSGVSLQGFRNSRAGAFVTHQLVRVLETFKLSPRGTVDTHQMLRGAQQALVESAKLGIFTPMYFFLARKP